MPVNIFMVFQQRAARTVGHVDGIPVGFRVVFPVPVFQQHCPAFVLAQHILLAFGHTHLVVLAVLSVDVWSLVRVVRLVPAQRMPAYLDARAAVLQILGLGVPQKGFNRPAYNGDIALSIVHGWIPYCLNNSRTRAVYVLCNTAVYGLVVVHVVDDKPHSVLQILGHAGLLGRFGQDTGFRHVLHLLSNDVVKRALERLQLKRRLPCILAVILSGVAHAQNFARLAGGFMVWPTALFKHFQPVVYLGQEFPFLFVKRLLANGRRAQFLFHSSSLL